MNDIKIIHDAKDFKSLEKSELYIHIFWEEPRNEWYKCVDCEELFWLSEKINNAINSCFCWGDLIKVYNIEQVKREREKQANKTWYIWRLAETLDSTLIGFMVWRKDTIENINDEKLLLKDNGLLLLQKNIKEIYSEFDFDNFFYTAEMGIEKTWRGKWIASKLYTDVFEKAKENMYRYTLLSTTTKEWWPYKWFEKLWYKKVLNYNDINDRIIMIKDNNFSSNPTKQHN